MSWPIPPAPNPLKPAEILLVVAFATLAAPFLAIALVALVVLAVCGVYIAGLALFAFTPGRPKLPAPPKDRRK